MCKSYDIIWTENMFYYIIISQPSKLHWQKKSCRVLLCSPSIFPANFLKKEILLLFTDAIHLRVNATVPQVGQEFIVIRHVPSELTDKIVRKNVLVKMGRLVIMSQVSLNIQYFYYVYVIYFFNGFFANCNKSAIIMQHFNYTELGQ